MWPGSASHPLPVGIFLAAKAGASATWGADASACGVLVSEWVSTGGTGRGKVHEVSETKTSELEQFLSLQASTIYNPGQFMWVIQFL